MTGPRYSLFPAEPALQNPSMPGGQARGTPLFSSEQDGRDSQLDQSKRLSVNTTPDAAARILKLQMKTGLSRDVISRNVDEIEAQSNRADFDPTAYRTKNPKVAEWLAEHPDNMALAKNDLENLGVIEGTIRAMQSGFNIGEATSKLGRWGTEAKRLRGQLKPEQWAEVERLERIVSEEPTGKKWWQSFVFNAEKFIGQQLDMGTELAGGAASGFVVGSVIGTAGGGGILSMATGPAGAAIGTVVGLSAGAARYAMMVEMGNSYLDLRKIRDENGNGLSEDTIQAASFGVGMLNMVLEVAGEAAIARPYAIVAKRFVKQSVRDMLVRPTMRRAMADFGKSYAVALGGETWTEVAQEIVSVVAEEMAKFMSDGSFKSITPEELMGRLTDVAVQTAQGMALIGLPGASIHAAHTVVQARKAQQRADYYTALGEGVEKSEVFDKLPEAMQDIVRRATKDGPMEKVFIDHEPFVEYWQGKQEVDEKTGKRTGPSPRDVAREIWGDTKEYDRAVETGEPMALSMADYATKIAPTEHNKFFSHELRRAPGEMNGREGKELEAKVHEEAKAAAESPEGVEEAKQLTDHISRSLEATGRYDAEASKTLAEQMGKWFATQGKRVGRSATELFNERGVAITGGEEEKVGVLEKVKKFFQGKRERIKSAVVIVNGKQYTGATHLDAWSDARSELIKTRNIDLSDNPRMVEKEGFITNKGRLLDRAEAYKVAQKSGQLGPVEPGDATDDDLTTEGMEELHQASLTKEVPLLPGFYSKAESVLQAKMGGRMKMGEVRKLLANAGVKADELEWSSLSKIDLDDNEVVDKATLLQLMAANRLVIEEGSPEGVNGSVDEHAYSEALAEMHMDLRDAYIDDHLDEFIDAKPDKDGNVVAYYWNYDSGRKSGDQVYRGPSRAAAKDALYNAAKMDIGLDTYLSQRARDEVDITDYTYDEGEESYEQYTLPGGKDYRQLLFTLPSIGGRGFAEGHYQEPNIFAHVRFKTRVDAQGRKVLFLEEVQSDWHEQGRDKGYEGEVGRVWTADDYNVSKSYKQGNTQYWNLERKEDGGRVVTVKSGETADEALNKKLEEDNSTSKKSNAPFKKNWHEFVLKRMLQYAVDNGFEAIGWTTGDQQLWRYPGTETAAQKVEYFKNEDGTYEINLSSPLSRGKDISLDKLSEAQVEKIVGPRLAEAIFEGQGGNGSAGLKLIEDLPNKYELVMLGGAGMRDFYNRQLVNVADKLGKKHGAKTTDGVIEYDVELEVKFDDSMGSSEPWRMGTSLNEYEPKVASFGKTHDEAVANGKAMHQLVITDALADAVRSTGFELFQEAWHGSPHIFDQFKLQHIGTGDGAQSFGWGLYFTGRKEIAQVYHDRNTAGSQLTYRGEVVKLLSDVVGTSSHQNLSEIERKALAYITENYSDVRVAVSEAKAMGESSEVITEVSRMASHPSEFDLVKKKGRVYKVDIPEDDTMLLWDKGFDEQSRAVRDALEKIGSGREGTGEDWYQNLAMQSDEEGSEFPEERASRTLAALGVTGIKYADQGSRWNFTKRLDGLWMAENPLQQIGPFESEEEARSTAERQTTYNYVVFDEDLIKIMEFEQRGENSVGNSIAISTLQKYIKTMAEGLAELDQPVDDAEIIDHYEDPMDGIEHIETAGVQAEQDRKSWSSWKKAAESMLDGALVGDREAVLAAWGKLAKGVQENMKDAIQPALMWANNTDIQEQKRSKDAERIKAIQWSRTHAEQSERTRTVIWNGTLGRFQETGEVEDPNTFGKEYGNRDGSVEVVNIITPDGVVWDVTPEGKKWKKSKDQYIEHRQGDDDAPRGKIEFGKGEANIRLFATADWSTFLHESGHLYLETFKDLAKDNKNLQDDYASILKFLGAKKGKNFTVEQHEKWARAIEAYFREGRAPSAGLRNAFRRYKAWLMSWYQTLTGLNVKLTDEVRGVMDRMFASEEEIASAENEAGIDHFFLTAEQAGMTEEEFASYQGNVQDAHDKSVEKLQLRLMREKIREQKTEWRNARAAFADEARAELGQQPVYRALNALQKGEWTLPDGTVTEINSKLDKASIVALKGEKFLKELPLPYVYSKEGGISVGQAAELFGFTSPDEMLESLATSPPLDAAAEKVVDEKMKEKFGDMTLDGTLSDMAEEAVLSNEREKIILDELRALQRQRNKADPQVKVERAVGRTALASERAERTYERRWLEAEKNLAILIERGAKQEEIEALRMRISREKAEALQGRAFVREATPNLKDVRAVAEARVANMRMVDAKPQTFWVAARRAGVAASKALGEQDWVVAAKEKYKELLNVALYRAVTQAKERADKTVAYVRTLEGDAAQKRLGLAGHDYRDQTNKLLERFDFSRMSVKAMDKRASMVDFIKSQEDKHLPVNIPLEFQNEAFRKPYKELTFEELAGLKDVLRHLGNLAKFKNKLIAAGRNRDFNAAKAGLVAEIESNSKGERGRVIETRLPEEETKRSFAGFFAAHRKLGSMLRRMAGFKDGGFLFDYIQNQINQAANKKTTMTAQMTMDLHALFDNAYSKLDMASMYTKTAAPSLGKSITRMARIMLALNWGTEDNRVKLVAGLAVSLKREVSESDVEAAMTALTQHDHNFIQSVHDYFETYWPQMEKLAKELDGVAPEKIAAVSRITQYGEYRGGYFPLFYDERQSRIARRNVEAKRASEVRHASAVMRSTKAGSRHERVTGVQLPVRLDFGVIFEALEDTAMDLTHTRMLIDVNRLLQDDDVETAIRDHYGDIFYREIMSAVRDIATGDLPAQSRFDRVLNFVRTGTSIAGLGWKTVTACIQPLGLTQSIVRIGPKWVAKGLSRWIRDAAHMENSYKWITEKSEFMRHRGRTQLREIDELRNHVGLASSKTAVYADLFLSKATMERVDLQDLQDSFFWFITRMQLTVDIPTWLGEYEKQMEAFDGDEEKAIALADQAVLDSQASGHIKDLASVQRGNPALKLWTNFYSFFSAAWNLHMESIEKTNFKSVTSVGRLGADMLLLSVIPAAMGLALRNALRGDDNPDDWTLEMFIREEMSYLAGMLVGVRELSSIIQGYHGYEGPAGSRIFAETGKLIQQVAQGEGDKALWHSLNNAAGILLHYPSAQIQLTVEGFLAWMDDKAPISALIFGPAPKK